MNVVLNCLEPLNHHHWGYETLYSEFEQGLVLFSIHTASAWVRSFLKWRQLIDQRAWPRHAQASAVHWAFYYRVGVCRWQGLLPPFTHHSVTILRCLRCEAVVDLTTTLGGGELLTTTLVTADKPFPIFDQKLCFQWAEGMTAGDLPGWLKETEVQPVCSFLLLEAVSFPF